jgi:hypothetical protein
MRVFKKSALFIFLFIISASIIYFSGPNIAAAQESDPRKNISENAGGKTKKTGRTPPAKKEKKSPAALDNSKAPTAEPATNKSSAAGILKSGELRFILTQHAVKIGDEIYSYAINADKTLKAAAEINIRSITDINITQRYSLAPGGLPLTYSIKAVVMGDTQKIDCVFKDDEIKAQVYKQDTVETISLRAPQPLFLLDNTNANNYQHIIDAYSHKAGGVQTFNIFVPQKLLLSSLEVENRGFVKGSIADKNTGFVEYRAVETKYGLEIFIYANSDGTVAAVIVPSQKFTIAVEGFQLDKTVRPLETRTYISGAYSVKETGMYFKTGGGLKLFSKLSMPEPLSPGGAERLKVPAALIIAGSGPTDCDGNSTLIGAPVNTLKDIAVHLASNGIASLRYDKRGTGDSESAGDSPFSAYVSDAADAYDFLCSKSEINSSEIYLIGHSEGAIIAMSAAARVRNPAGAILMAAPFTPFDKLILDQVKYNLDYSVSISAADKHEFIKQLSDTIDQLKKGRAPKLKDSYSVPSMALLITSLAGQPKFAGEYLNLSPAKIAAGVKIPVLLINAALDIQVPVSDFDQYCKLFEKNKIKFKKLLINGVNHVFKPAKEKNDVKSYTTDSKVSKEALNAIIVFINECRQR